MVHNCDGKSILLTSLLRNYYDPDKVFCAVGIWKNLGKEYGHMWVMIEDKNGVRRIVEATAPSSAALFGQYNVLTLFNDQYTFSSDRGLEEFDFIPVPLGVYLPAEAVAP